MKHLVLASVLVALLASIMPGPEPPALTVVAPTPEGLQAQLDAEAKQRAYDAAEETASRVLRTHCGDDEFAELIAQNALDQHVPVKILAAVVVVESTCRPGVESKEHACGLMQVSSRVWKQSCELLKDPDVNVRKGTEILAGYIKRAGGVREGLHRYNGLGVGCESCDEEYPDKVLLVAYGGIQR